MVHAIIAGLAIALVAVPLDPRHVAEIQAAGGRRGILSALNAVAGDVPRALVVLLALAQLPSWFLQGSRLAGGLLLIYIAWRAVRKWQKGEARRENRTALNRPLEAPLSLAVWLLDPTLYLLWATVVGPLLLASWRDTPSWGLAFLGGLYAALFVGTCGLYVPILSLKKHGPQIARIISGLYMAAAVSLAFLHIWRGAEALLGRFF